MAWPKPVINDNSSYNTTKMKSIQNAECVKALNSDKQLRELRRLLSEVDEDDDESRDMLEQIISARVKAIKEQHSE